MSPGGSFQEDLSIWCPGLLVGEVSDETGRQKLMRRESPLSVCLRRGARYAQRHGLADRRRRVAQRAENFGRVGLELADGIGGEPSEPAPAFTRYQQDALGRRVEGGPGIVAELPAEELGPRGRVSQPHAAVIAGRGEAGAVERPGAGTDPALIAPATPPGTRPRRVPLQPRGADG